MKWIDKTKMLPFYKMEIEAKDKDGDILCGIGKRKLRRKDLLADDYITHWRYVKKSKTD